MVDSTAIVRSALERCLPQTEEFGLVMFHFAHLAVERAALRSKVAESENALATERERYNHMEQSRANQSALLKSAQARVKELEEALRDIMREPHPTGYSGCYDIAHDALLGERL